MNFEHFVQWFRQAGPYINVHRGRTFVVQFGGAAVETDAFSSLMEDLALLHSLGIRLVLAHGARPQIEQRLREAGREWRYVNGLRVTEAEDLCYIKQAIGRVRIRIEARLSMGLANSPMHGARPRVVSGNLVTARPLGVRDGVDYGFTGEVRRIDDRAIRLGLEQDAIVLLSPLGYSPTGEIFNLSAEEVATAAAHALRADKLLILSENLELRDPAGQPVRELSPSDAERLLAEHPTLNEETARHLRLALRACQAGVRRVHLLDRRLDGALLLELFTRDGAGTRRATTGRHRRCRRPAGTDPAAGERRRSGAEVAGAAGNGNRPFLRIGARWRHHRLHRAVSLRRGASGRTGLRRGASGLPQ